MGLRLHSTSPFTWGILVLVLTGWWVGLGPDTNDFKMALASTVSLLELSSPKTVGACIYTSEWSLSPASLGGCWSSAGGSDQAPFWLLLLPWSLEYVRFCVHTLRVESLYPTALALLKVSPTGLPSPPFWKPFFPFQDPQVRKPNVGSYPSLLRENLCNKINSQLWIVHPGVWVLIIPCLQFSSVA